MPGHVPPPAPDQGPPRPAEERRDSGNITLAVLLSLVIGGLITTLAAVSAMSSKSTSRDRAYTLAVQAADSGVQDALYLISRDRLNPVAPGARRQGATPVPLADGSEFDWGAAYTAPTFGSPSSTWRITSTGWFDRARTSQGRTVVATIRSSPRFPNAVFTDRSTKLVGNNTVDTYDSRNGLWPAIAPVTRSLGGNGTITYPAASTTLDGGTALSTGAYLSDVTSDTAMAFITDRGGAGDVGSVTCTKPRSEWTVWRASENLGADGRAVFPSPTATAPATAPPPFCYSQLVFDRSTVLSSWLTWASPAVVYVRDTVTTSSRVRVNAPHDKPATGSLPAPPDAPALQIYSDTSQEINWGTKSVFAGALYAPRAECGEKSGAGVEIYGSIVCGVFNSRGGWKIHYDASLFTVATSPYTITSWRERSYVVPSASPQEW